MKYFLAMLLLYVPLATNFLYGMEEEKILKPSSDIVTNASYFVYEGTGERGTISSDSKRVTFYSAGGDPIKTIEHYNCGHLVVQNKLDPAAPLPQPTTCVLHYRVGMAGEVGKQGATYIKENIMFFYDKHNNCVKRLESEYQSIVSLNDLQKLVVGKIDLKLIDGNTIVDKRAEDDEFYEQCVLF